MFFFVNIFLLKAINSFLKNFFKKKIYDKNKLEKFEFDKNNF